MPELPEVETVARGLSPLSGKRLLALDIHDARVWFESEGDPALLSNLRLLEVSRRGKYLLLRFENGLTVVQHLRMTGKMLEARSRLVPTEVSVAVGLGRGKGLQIRCAFRFEDAEYWFYDTRRFGTLTLVRDEETFFREKKIAPDPIHEPARAFDWFAEKLAKTAKPIKAALLDQSVVAGVGNIYADEALFAAGIHPRTPARRVRDPRPLWLHILRILQESIRQGGSTIRDYVSAEGREGAFAQSHFVYDREGEPCRECGTAIERITLGGRSTHYCPKCQPGYAKPKAATKKRSGKRARAKAARTKGSSRRRRSPPPRRSGSRR
jgi:formamidopyrimidine-DNA glycosylase